MTIRSIGIIGVGGVGGYFGGKLCYLQQNRAMIRIADELGIALPKTKAISILLAKKKPA
jgi:ketopantoate reductase